MTTVAQLTTNKKEPFELQTLRAQPSLMPLLKEGDLVEVTLFERANRAVYFDVPRVGTGVIYAAELANTKSILKGLSVGDMVTARVISPENEKGLVELSLAEAGKQKAWQEVKDLKEKDEPIVVTINNANTGGLTTEVAGLQAFLPASQLSNEHYPQSAGGDRTKILQELKNFIGKELTVKIIGLNPRMNKLIISEREAATHNVKDLLKNYSIGDVVPGIISGVASFGAFIRFADNPEVEGLIHISELHHRLIDNPKEVVKIGDLVQAKITEIKDGRVSLSLKALQKDPWENIEGQFQEGAVITGVVYKLTPFGAFIKLTEDIIGLIHVSEFGSLDELKRRLEKDNQYEFIIDSIKPADRRIVLKLHAPDSAPATSEKSEESSL